MPDDVTGRELGRDVLAELASLRAELATEVARHLVVAARELDEDPSLAYAHAVAARRLAPRLASTREAVGLAAYLDGKYSEALAELRATRRLTGTQEHLPVMADCERGLGRPERALAIASSAEADRLDHAGRVEMRIIAAGARRDMGQPEAAVVTLQGRDLSTAVVEPWTVRLQYAYADALLATGRSEEALEWFRRAAESDQEGSTDAEERIAELDGSEIIDLLTDEAAPDAATLPAVGLRSPGREEPRVGPEDTPPDVGPSRDLRFTAPPGRN